MAVKIRLARKGRKKLAYYHIVVADSRSPRDGRYIEKIGKYNPLTNPATIELDFDKALGWLQNGAIPSDTCRAILSYKGVLIKKHLLEGVRKGAFDEAEADKRFEEWMKNNQEKIDAKKSGLEKSRDDKMVEMLAAEKKINEARSVKLAKKQAEMAAKAEAAEKQEAGDKEEPQEDVTTSETTEVVSDTIETPAEKEPETTDDTPDESVTESEAVDAPVDSEPEEKTADAEIQDEAIAADAASETESESKMAEDKEQSEPEPEEKSEEDKN